MRSNLKGLVTANKNMKIVHCAYLHAKWIDLY